jgi:hypothetical protein
MQANVSELVRSVVHCPVCTVVCPPPLMACGNGHAVCATCLRGMIKSLGENVCPICRLSLCSPPMFRMLAIEQLAKDEVFSCEYGGCSHRCSYQQLQFHRMYECVSLKCGCNESDAMHASDEHGVFCKYGTMRCMMPGCEWTGRRVSYNEHLRDKHDHHYVWVDRVNDVSEVLVSETSLVQNLVLKRVMDESKLVCTVERKRVVYCDESAMAVVQSRVLPGGFLQFMPLLIYGLADHHTVIKLNIGVVAGVPARNLQLQYLGGLATWDRTKKECVPSLPKNDFGIHVLESVVLGDSLRSNLPGPIPGFEMSFTLFHEPALEEVS